MLVIGYVYGDSSLNESLDNRPGYLAEYRDVGAWLAAHMSKTDTIASIEIGVIGRLSNCPILDTMGLTSLEMRGHLVGWVETLTYAIGERNPEYAVTLKGTAWIASLLNGGFGNDTTPFNVWPQPYTSGKSLPQA